MRDEGDRLDVLPVAAILATAESDAELLVFWNGVDKVNVDEANGDDRVEPSESLELACAG